MPPHVLAVLWLVVFNIGFALAGVKADALGDMASCPITFASALQSERARSA